MHMDLSTLMPQQREIVTTLDRPLFVSAGAGSGKTFTLTKRIAYALSEQSGPYLDDLGQVLAITFTTDAATELRERVRAELMALGLEREALAVDDAWISTIHGMCSRILRSHALELGLDPEFSVLDEIAADQLLDQAVDTVVSAEEASRRAGERSDLDALLEWYPLVGERGPRGEAESVKSLVKRLIELASALPGGMDDVHIKRGRVDFSGAIDAMRCFIKDHATSKKGCAVCAESIALLEGAEASGGLSKRDLERLLVEVGTPRSSKGTKPSVSLIRAELADAFVNAFLADADGALSELESLARRVEAEFRALKDARSALDNNDLLRLAYRAIREHESIRASLSGRFKMCMVDEFQDTDQQQIDLIAPLTGEGGRALCTVGDAQQSIYRFRGAEVEVFRGQQAAIERGDGGAGRVVQLVRNFRSHVEILEYVARVFDGEAGGIMRGFLDLEPSEGRKDGLAATGASRRQAVLVAGKRRDERTLASARAIARRFRALADAGQPAGGMVVLLGGMPRSGVYAAALREEGLDCVISGGSVYADAPEVASVRALVNALANPLDAADGLVPLLASPMFALGVEEMLALCTALDPATGETRRRSAEAGLFSDDDVPGLDGLPLLARAREVLRCALKRMGREPFADVVEDVVRESGWFARLATRGPEGRAVAANVWKAIDELRALDAELGAAPREIALRFADFLKTKQAPGALNEGDSGAVRIMTVHASKGLEFPVVAVAECFSVGNLSSPVQIRRGKGRVDVVALPSEFAGVRTSAGEWVPQKKVGDAFSKLRKEWYAPELAEAVSSGDSAAFAYMEMRDEERVRALEERARLLYVAMTRAKEVLLLAMEAPISSVGAPRVSFDPERDLTGAVLERILPEGAGLDCDRLVFDGSAAGDYELVALDDFSCDGRDYGANAEAPAASAEGAADEADWTGEDSLTLLDAPRIDWRARPDGSPRDTYSYSRIASELNAAHEDRGENRPDGETGDGGVRADAPAPPGSAGALEFGSAFHAACQWLIENAADELPQGRLDALARRWLLDATGRERLSAALGRWVSSDVRAELLAWPCIRAEVPFFVPASEEFAEAFGSYAEGAIDALGTDPAHPDRALVVDYKTGGSSSETPEGLREKHALQARVYADALFHAGYSDVEAVFVRVEVEDPAHPGQPQTVRYRFSA